MRAAISMPDLSHRRRPKGAKRPTRNECSDFNALLVTPAKAGVQEHGPTL